MSFMIKLSVSKKKSVRSKLLGGLLLLSVSLFFIFSSCRRSPHLLGADILPENARLQIFYGFWDGISAYSKSEDSLRTDELSVNLLGSKYDSTFGITTANIAVQYSLSTNGYDFGENPQLDSLVLYLRYTGKLYGDSNSVQHLHIYELDQDIYKDSAYFASSSFEKLDIDYADFTFVPKPNDSVAIGEDTLPPLIRINLSKLNDQLAQKLLAADTSILADNDKFMEYFKGLYLESEPVVTGGAMYGVNFLKTNSGLIIYYSNDEQDSLHYRFNVNSATARINNYIHDYTNSPQDFKQHVLQGDTALGHEKFYVQGAGGVKTIINIPDIRDYTDSKEIALNEVKLVLPGFEGATEAPAQLALVEITEDGSYKPLIDQYEGPDYFGGTYQKSTNQYVFRITRYMQSIFTGDEPNNGLYLFVSGAAINPEGFVFKGNKMEGDTLGMRLEILFTDLDDRK